MNRHRQQRTKRLAAALLLAVACPAEAATLSAFGYRWDVPDAADWKVETPPGVQLLELVKARGPLPGPRRPIQFALAETPAFGQVKMQVDVRPHQRSLILVFAYRDPAHFDYAHLSTDTGVAQPVHNGVFHVFGGERVRISSQAGPAAFPASNRWYHVTLSFDGETGSLSVTVDGHSMPSLHAFDLSLTAGRVGLGSFDETGDFSNVQIAGQP